MSVPNAIQKQADKAEALQKELASATPVEVVSDVPKVVNVNPETEFVSAEPGELPGQVAKPAETPAQPQLQDGDTWEHKYSVLQGKYNSDLTELREQLESQAGTVANLNSLIVSMNSNSPAPIAEPSQDGVRPQDGQRVVDPEDFTGYGAEMIELVKLVQSQSSELAMLKGETNKLSEKQVKTEADVYFETLDGSVKDWRVLNKNQGFLDWLKESDGLSDISRQENMTAAHMALDAKGVAKYFLAYIANGNQTPNNATLSPSPQPNTVQPNLLSMVVPFDTGTRTEITQPGNEQKVTVTRDQFNKAVSDKVKGKITDEQFKVISDNFQRSIAAGQI